MADGALVLDGVTGGYGRMHIVEDISFAIGSGEKLAIIGRNGAGKTTLLSTIMGLNTQHGGTIELFGKPLNKLATHERARLGLGLVPQTRDVFPSLTVEENLIAGVDAGESIDAAYELFPRIKERRRNRGSQLSGGEQQMLSIARTMLGRPSVLLLDEPLEGLAPVIRDELMAVLNKLAAGGEHTILLVEQHIELALGFADKAIVLDSGKLVYSGASEDLAAHHDILDRHVGVALQT